MELFQSRYLCVGGVTSLGAFRLWIAAKKCRQVAFELLSCRSDHAFRRCRGTGLSQCICEATRQENERLFKEIYKERLLPKKDPSNLKKNGFLNSRQLNLREPLLKDMLQ
jgi:hypothetical protein